MLTKIDQWDKLVIAYFQGLLQKSPIFNSVANFLAAWPVYFVPMALVVYWFAEPKWRAVEIRAALAGLVAWQVINRILQAIFERGRPVDGAMVSELLFERPSDSFPSNHAAFGIAVFLSLFLAGERTLSAIVLALTLTFSLFRAITGLHFPSDIIIGWLIGALTAFGLSFIASYIDQYVAEPIIRFAKLIKLA